MALQKLLDWNINIWLCIRGCWSLFLFHLFIVGEVVLWSAALQTQQLWIAVPFSGYSEVMLLICICCLMKGILHCCLLRKTKDDCLCLKSALLLTGKKKQSTECYF